MLARQGDGERKTHISKTDDSNVHVREPLLLACGGRGEPLRLQIARIGCASVGLRF
jgi:hypothetical protein